MASKWKRISDMINTRLATISVANGYNTEIGSKVTNWKLDDWTSGQLPGVAYRLYDQRTEETEKFDPLQAAAYGEKHDLSLEVIVGTEKATSTTSTAIEAEIMQMVEDVEKAFRAEQIDGGRCWQGLADWTVIESIEMNMEKKEKIVGEARIIFKIRIRTKYLNAVN